jgi:hypothetical protein
MAIGKPFTLQYARERVAAERATSPQLAKINFVITSVWALAFVCIVVADVLTAYVPTVPIRVGIVVTVLALVAAYKFTGWYPKRGNAAQIAVRSSAGAGDLPNYPLCEVLRRCRMLLRLTLARRECHRRIPPCRAGTSLSHRALPTNWTR